jgi:hypothetical protein
LFPRNIFREMVSFIVFGHLLYYQNLSLPNKMATILENLRSWRVSKFSIFDLSISVVSGWYIGKYFGYDPLLSAILSIPIGELVHYILGIQTAGLNAINNF